MATFRYINKTVVIHPLDDIAEYAVKEYNNQLFSAVYQISEKYRVNEFYARECKKSEIIEALISAEKVEWRPGAYYVDRINKVLVIPDVVEDEYDRGICIALEPTEEEEDP